MCSKRRNTSRRRNIDKNVFSSGTEGGGLLCGESGKVVTKIEM